MPGPHPPGTSFATDRMPFPFPLSSSLIPATNWTTRVVGWQHTPDSTVHVHPRTPHTPCPALRSPTDTSTTPQNHHTPLHTRHHHPAPPSLLYQYNNASTSSSTSSNFVDRSAPHTHTSRTRSRKVPPSSKPTPSLPCPPPHNSSSSISLGFSNPPTFSWRSRSA